MTMLAASPDVGDGFTHNLIRLEMGGQVFSVERHGSTCRISAHLHVYKPCMIPVGINTSCGKDYRMYRC